MPTTVCDDVGNCTTFDDSGNAVSTDNIVGPTFAGESWTTPTTPATPVDASGGFDINNLTRFFGSLGSLAGAIGSAVGTAQGKPVAPICPSTLPCAAPNKPGFLYNPQTGQYTPQATSNFSLSNLTAGSGLVILLVVVIGIFLVARR